MKSGGVKLDLSKLNLSLTSIFEPYEHILTLAKSLYIKFLSKF